MADAVIVTDAKYRAALAAVRSLGEAGYTVILTQTIKDSPETIPASYSVHAAETLRLEGSVSDESYKERLKDAVLTVSRKYGRPALFPVGAVTLATLAEHESEFGELCDFLVADPDTLRDLNDKETVAKAAQRLSIRVPKAIEGTPDRYPVIIKPRCGEKFGLTAKDRYIIAANREDYEKGFAAMSRYGGPPLVQEKIDGDGIGVSVLMGKEGETLSYICHRRLREYPATGGPSACCVSIRDEQRAADAVKLLRSFGFRGFAMVEFKGDALLEVNPRIWGSYPLTYVSGSSFAENYVKAAKGRSDLAAADDYKAGVKMHFILSDLAACADYLRRGQTKKAAAGFADILFHRAAEGMDAKGDRRPYRTYLRLKLLKK